MKKNTLLLLFSLFANFLFAQTETFGCGTIEDPNTTQQILTKLNNGVYSGSTDPNYLAQFEPVSFQIYFWIINRDDGSNDATIDYELIRQHLEAVNNYYRPMNICFMLKGYDDFNISDIYNHNSPSFSTILNKAQQQGKYMPNAFNVYITKNLVNGNGVTYFGGDQIAIKHSHFVQGTRGDVLAHELAHDFGLYHPWGGANGTTYTAEHVTRDPNDSNYNALSSGDLVHDTPAMVSFYDEAQTRGLLIGDILDLNTCEYEGILTDNLGIPFDLTPTDVGNVMTYT